MSRIVELIWSIRRLEELIDLLSTLSFLRKEMNIFKMVKVDNGTQMNLKQNLNSSAESFLHLRDQDYLCL